MYPNPEIFGFTLSWYSLFHWLGVAAAVLFILWYYIKSKTLKINIWQAAGVVIVLYATLMFGGRLVGLAEAWLKTGSLPHWTVFLQGPSAGQFRWCGSLLLTLLLFPVAAKKLLKIKPTWQLFDMLAMSFCAMTIFTKQGCQFSGDGCYGIVTNLPWGMYYPYGAAPNIFPVHPTPIYDSVFHILFFVALLWWDIKRKQHKGETTIIYFVGAAVFYILLELVRINPVVAYSITLPQLVYFLILLACCWYGSQKKNKCLINSKKRSLEERLAEPTWF